MPRYHTVKCGLGRVKPVLVSLSSQQYANPLSLEVRASPHLRVPRVSDQKSLSNEDGLFGRFQSSLLSRTSILTTKTILKVVKNMRSCLNFILFLNKWKLP